MVIWPSSLKTSHVQWMSRLSASPERAVSSHHLNLTLAEFQWCRIVLVEQERVEQELLLRRLKPVEAGYDIDGRCMEGTRQYILNRVLEWVTNPHASTDAPRTYWLYGSPGIGKSSLAHSICEKLHHQKHLAGGFFCRRDDPNLSKPKSVLPTLINTLAGILPHFRGVVADRLRDDPNLTSNSMDHSLFL